MLIKVIIGKVKAITCAIAWQDKTGLCLHQTSEQDKSKH